MDYYSGIKSNEVLGHRGAPLGVCLQLGSGSWGAGMESHMAPAALWGVCFSFCLHLRVPRPAHAHALPRSQINKNLIKKEKQAGTS